MQGIILNKVHYTFSKNFLKWSSDFNVNAGGSRCRDIMSFYIIKSEYSVKIYVKTGNVLYWEDKNKQIILHWFLLSAICWNSMIWAVSRLLSGEGWRIESWKLKKFENSDTAVHDLNFNAWWFSKEWSTSSLCPICLLP